MKGDNVMRHFDNIIDFNKEMQIFKNVLEEKGYVLESDHVYAYEMQHTNAFKDVSDWLFNNGYMGELETSGFCEGGIAVYGLYDSTRISIEEMQKRLSDELKSQNQAAT